MTMSLWQRPNGNVNSLTVKAQRKKPNSKICFSRPPPVNLESRHGQLRYRKLDVDRRVGPVLRRPRHQVHVAPDVGQFGVVNLA